ncbi:hypothetical protein EYF80_009511 [Liparis tanakae]|uniref:Uncharacterized protein n=1 Tax=Liparis tanakae TaxID=230148 RepID=A0A4Z2IQP8_9TELE|nr:hypothetical protein EYF80_009511 [Liparis tanakae]
MAVLKDNVPPILCKLRDHFQALHPIIFGRACIRSGIVRQGLTGGEEFTTAHLERRRTGCIKPAPPCLREVLRHSDGGVSFTDNAFAERRHLAANNNNNSSSSPGQEVQQHRDQFTVTATVSKSPILQSQVSAKHQTLRDGGHIKEVNKQPDTLEGTKQREKSRMPYRPSLQYHCWLPPRAAGEGAGGRGGAGDASSMLHCLLTQQTQQGAFPPRLAVWTQLKAALPNVAI